MEIGAFAATDTDCCARGVVVVKMVLEETTLTGARVDLRMAAGGYGTACGACAGALCWWFTGFSVMICRGGGGPTLMA